MGGKQKPSGLMLAVISVGTCVGHVNDAMISAETLCLLSTDKRHFPDERTHVVVVNGLAAAVKGLKDVARAKGLQRQTEDDESTSIGPGGGAASLGSVGGPAVTGGRGDLGGGCASGRRLPRSSGPGQTHTQRGHTFQSESCSFSASIYIPERRPAEL